MVIPNWSAPPKPPSIEFEPQVESQPYLQLARPLDRLAAVIVDLFVVLAPVYILLSAPFKRWMTTSFILGMEPEFAFMIVAMISLALGMIVIYQTFMHGFFGATIGKMLFDLKVRPMFQEDKLGLWDSFVRSVLWVIEVFCFFIPFLAVFSNSKRRVLHDKVCDTVVVSESEAHAVAPGGWERGMVRGLFSFFFTLMFLTFVSQTRAIFERVRVQDSLMAQLEQPDAYCEVVSLNLAGNGAEHERLQMAMSLYAAGLVDRSCLESEIEREMAYQVPVGAITYLVQAFVHADDAEVSNAYLDQVCEEAPEEVECSMAKVVALWSEEDWDGVSKVLTEAKSGSGYLEVWAIRHFMKQGSYLEALHFLDGLVGHRQLAEFSMPQRVKALWNAYREAEATAALAQAASSLPEEQAADLSAWVCAQQLQKGCDAAQGVACTTLKKNEISEIDFERPAEALSQVMAMECRESESLDYQSFSDSVASEDWQMFFRANLKYRNNDIGTAAGIYSQLAASPSAPEILRIEAVRRFSQMASPKQLESLLEVWSRFESRETWIKTGNILLASLMQKGQLKEAREMANNLSLSGGLSPYVTALMQETGKENISPRRPASKESR